MHVDTWWLFNFEIPLVEWTRLGDGVVRKFGAAMLSVTRPRNVAGIARGKLCGDRPRCGGVRYRAEPADGRDGRGEVHSDRRAGAAAGREGFERCGAVWRREGCGGVRLRVDAGCGADSGGQRDRPGGGRNPAATGDWGERQGQGVRQ